MGRLLVIAGLLMLVAGLVGTGVSILQPVQDIVSTVADDTAVDDRAAEFCEPGEELIKEQGASSYTPGRGWGRPVYYYCTRLRSLEQARAANLITQEEYDRLRQQILDGFA